MSAVSRVGMQAAVRAGALTGLTEAVIQGADPIFDVPESEYLSCEGKDGTQPQ